MRYLHICLFVLLLASVSAISCGKKTGTYTIEIIDGVKYIHNHAPLWGENPKISMEFVRQIGELDAIDENYQLYEIADVLSDDDGNVYVLDAGNFRVQKFDAGGEYVLSMGRRGQGPGEFDNAVEFDLFDYKIYVRESSHKRVEVFDLLGDHIRSFPLKHTSTRFRVFGSDRYVLRKPFITPVEDYVFEITNENSEIIREFGVPLRLDNDEKTGNLHSIDPKSVVKVNDVYIETEGNRAFYAVYRCQNRIEKYTQEGILLFRIDRTVDFEIVNKVENQEVTSGAKKLIFSTLSLTPLSERIGIDYRGRIWVATYTSPLEWDNEIRKMRVAGKLLEVFDREGILLSRLPFPDNSLEFMRICGDKMYFCDEDYISVHQYRIIEH